MYEHKTKPLLSPQKFIMRLVAHGGAAVIIIAVSLAAGIIGYHVLGKLSWVDALLNASMILGGMGPVDALSSSQAKIFASIYALYSGLVLLVTVGILFAPLFHRLMHKFHLQNSSKE